MYNLEFMQSFNFRIVLTPLLLTVISSCAPRGSNREKPSGELLTVVEGIHVQTGLKEHEYLPIVIAHCTGCHSAHIITQNRATRDGWENMIVWMQKTQSLPDLGSNREAILDYLSENYAPEETGRRKSLGEIIWYDYEETLLK